MKYIVGIALLTVLCCVGCRKPEALPPLQGVVVDAWDNHGIAAAGVKLQEYQASGAWAGGYATRDTVYADDSGVFDLSRHSTYDALNAFHNDYHSLPISNPEHYSTDDLNPVRITLNPLAWVVFTAEDTGTPNPDMQSIEVESTDAWLGNHSILNSPSEVYEVNEPSPFAEVMINTNDGGTLSSAPLSLGLIKNDTLWVTVSY